MPFSINTLTEDSIEDAVAYWLYTEDAAWQRWRLVAGSPVFSPNGHTLRMRFELESEIFELAIIQRDLQLAVKFDDRDKPAQELPARAFESSDEAIITFVNKDEIVFVHLELAI